MFFKFLEQIKIVHKLCFSFHSTTTNSNIPHPWYINRLFPVTFLCHDQCNMLISKKTWLIEYFHIWERNISLDVTGVIVFFHCNERKQLHRWQCIVWIALPGTKQTHCLIFHWYLYFTQFHTALWWACDGLLMFGHTQAEKWTYIYLAMQNDPGNRS